MTGGRRGQRGGGHAARPRRTPRSASSAAQRARPGRHGKGGFLRRTVTRDAPQACETPGTVGGGWVRCASTKLPHIGNPALSVDPPPPLCRTIRYRVACLHPQKRGRGRCFPSSSSMHLSAAAAAAPPGRSQQPVKRSGPRPERRRRKREATTISIRGQKGGQPAEAAPTSASVHQREWRHRCCSSGGGATSYGSLGRRAPDDKPHVGALPDPRTRSLETIPGHQRSLDEPQSSSTPRRGSASC